MLITIDTKNATILVCDDGFEPQTLPLYSDAAFEILSRQWLKVGWSRKYSYTFTWMGRPLIQLPEDVLRIQEVLWTVKPDVIIETGVAHGGSLILYASLCKAMGKGRVIGVDIEIRPHNRQAIEAHPHAGLITLIEGNSIAPEIVNRVRELVRAGESVFVILDSCHTHAHVQAELDAYHSLITPGSYIVATDGIMHDLHDVPGGEQDWTRNNPSTAAREFAAQHPEFEHTQPPWIFNGSTLQNNITYWPEAWLRRR